MFLVSATSQSKIRAFWVLHVLKIGPAGISTHKKCSKGCAGQFEDDEDSDIEHPDGDESDDGDDSDDSEESGCEDAPAEALSEQEVAEEDERLKTLELDDLEAFTNAKILAADLGVCACCGEERGDHLMHQCIYSKSDALFDPLEGNLVLIPGEPIRVCTRCRKVLMQKKRPRWAHHFPNMDIRFTQLTQLEFRLVRPIVPVITIFELPGEGQLSTIGGSISFFNDSSKVVLWLSFL